MDNHNGARAQLAETTKAQIGHPPITPGPLDSHQGILAAIGDTPLVEFSRLYRASNFRVFAKLEALNPGGSIKDRPATAIVSQEIRDGRIVPGRTTIVESTSGNMGVGLAQACKYYGIDLICVVDPKTPRQVLSILRAFGARVDIVTNVDPETDEYLPSRLRRVQELLAKVTDGYWPNQYSNPLNAAAHVNTMGEIIKALGSVDYVFCATSTCGTLRGCFEYLSQSALTTELVAVDAVGSAIFGDPAFRRLIPGHGATIVPDLYRPDLADAVVHVTDRESLIGCRMLMSHEAYLAGGSSGAVAAGVAKYAHRIRHGATCVMILPDRGERYVDTIYDESWVTQHFGSLRDKDISWRSIEVDKSC